MEQEGEIVAPEPGSKRVPDQSPPLCRAATVHTFQRILFLIIPSNFQAAGLDNIHTLVKFACPAAKPSFRRGFQD